MSNEFDDLIISHELILMFSDVRYRISDNCKIAGYLCHYDNTNTIDSLITGGDNEYFSTLNMCRSDWFPYVESDTINNTLKLLVTKITPFITDPQWTRRISMLLPHLDIKHSRLESILLKWEFPTFSKIDNNKFDKYVLELIKMK